MFSLFLSLFFFFFFYFLALLQLSLTSLPIKIALRTHVLYFRLSGYKNNELMLLCGRLCKSGWRSSGAAGSCAEGVRHTHHFCAPTGELVDSGLLCHVGEGDDALWKVTRCLIHFNESMRTHVATGIVSYVDSITSCALGEKKQIWLTFIKGDVLCLFTGLHFSWSIYFLHPKHSVSACLLHKHCWCSEKPVFAVWCKMHHYQSRSADQSQCLKTQGSNHGEIYLAVTGLISIVWTRSARVWM